MRVVTWTAPKVAKVVADRLGLRYITRRHICVGVDQLRREVQIARRTMRTYDRAERRVVESPGAWVLCDVTYPPEIDAEEVLLTLGISFELGFVPPEDEQVGNIYPWPTTPPDDTSERLWRDVDTLLERALNVLPDPAALVRMLLTEGRSKTVDGLHIGQFMHTGYPKRLARALIIARMADLQDVEPEVDRSVQRHIRSKGEGESFLNFLDDYRKAGVDSKFTQLP